MDYTQFGTEEIAQEIIDDVNKLVEVMRYMGGGSPNINEIDAEKILTDILENPTYYAMGFLSRNLLKLNKISNHIGNQNKYYQELFDSVANVVIGITGITVMNAKMISASAGFKNSLNDPDVKKIKQSLTESLAILNTLEDLNPSPNMKYQISLKQNEIKNLEKIFNSFSGCYIATHVYGDYNSPEVIKLRLFRDKVLSKSRIGNYIISRYYVASPKLVSRYSKDSLLFVILKTFLNIFLKILK